MFVLGIRLGIPRWRSSRRKSYSGWVKSADKTNLQECFVREFSAGGAWLTLSRPADIPNEFTLSLRKDGTVQRYCRVIWKLNKVIAIRFV